MKTKLELSPRLERAAQLVPDGAVLADIGTDHAYLPASLLLRGRISHAIAADLRSGPLSRARQTAQDYQCGDRMEFRLCDGLQGIRPGECSCIVIAGMGGETIAQILAAAPWTRTGEVTLILQPMSTQKELRAYLNKNGYAILEEHLVQEGDTIYVILLARGGQEPEMTPGQLWAGRQREDPLRGAYLTMLLEKMNRALAGLALSRDERQIQRREALEAARRELAEMRKECGEYGDGTGCV